jgi:hypothetical protein
MSRSKKGGLLGRRRSALERLEKAYEEFKKAGVDKAPHVSTRNGKPHTHKGRKYADECKRMEEQIKILKGRVNG